MDHNPAAARVAPPLYPFEGKVPQIHPSAFVAPTAAVIGDVTIGEGSNIWYHCVLRGDTNFIRIGARVNIQDGTIVHVNRGAEATLIHDDVTVGHAAIVHACTLERRAFEFVPYVPAGLVQQPMAFRKSLTGMVLSPVQFFWNMEKKA